MFKEYQSKPTTRRAYRITSEDDVTYSAEANEATLVRTGLVFGAVQQPVAGDYICKISEDDIYLIHRELFEERNIV